MIYGYKCKCGSTIEIERSMHEEALAPLCIDCHETMTRVWDTPAITFKGAGFYKTDNQSKQQNPAGHQRGLLIVGDGKRAKTSNLLGQMYHRYPE